MFQLSNAVSDDLVRYLIVKIFKFEYDAYLSTFNRKMRILESVFFADFGDFSQLLLTACWLLVKFDMGNLERVFWSLLSPNVLVRNLILALGAKKNRFFSSHAGSWNNHLQMEFLNFGQFFSANLWEHCISESLPYGQIWSSKSLIARSESLKHLTIRPYLY